MAVSREEDFDDLFEDDGIGEELDNEKENVDEMTNNEGSRFSPFYADNDGDIEELVSLFDDEEVKQDEQVEKNDSNKLEEEYLELQRKMKEIQEKLQRKKSNSPEGKSKTAELETKKSESDAVTQPEREASTSDFLAAFGNADFAASIKKEIPKLEHVHNTSKKENIHSKRPGSGLWDVEHPPQKKRRLANKPDNGTVANASSSHPFTSNLRGESSSNPSGTRNGHQVSSVRKASLMKQEEPRIVAIERFSRLRLKKCLVNEEEMKQRMQGKRFLKLSLIRPTSNMSDDTDWVTIGVVSKQMERQSAKDGKSFSIWHLTDLDDCSKSVTFFLFNKIHNQLKKQYGMASVIGFLNPSIMPPKKEGSSNNFDNTPALTIDDPAQIMHIGESADLGWCNATKWRNKQPAGKCLAVVNKQISEVCIFHMQSKYKKAGGRRSELQGSVGAPVAQKYKNTIWNKVKNDQFFYGGNVYSASPPSMSTTPKSSRTEPKIKITSFLSNAASLTEESKKELLEKSRVMKALSGIDEDHSLAGCSPAFADMLSSGDNVAGSRQYLNHLKKMQKDKEEAKAKKANIQSITPAELLKQQRQMIQDRKKNALVKQKLEEIKRQSSPSPLRRQPLSALSTFKQSPMQSPKSSPKMPGVTYTSPAEIRQKVADMVKAKKLELVGRNSGSPTLGSTPKLGQGLSSNTEIDLLGDWLSPRRVHKNANQVRKKKAIAKLRNEAGVVSLEKENPNKGGVLGKVKDLQDNDRIKKKIRDKVEENRRDDLENDKENESVENETNKRKFSDEEFQKILNARSSHSRAVEEEQLEEQEKYFNPLIRKEMIEKKMAETFEVTAKVVTCRECSYTYWGPHERCNQLAHHLSWSSVKKKFFQCSQCNQRIATWETYPSKRCGECGTEKLWHRTSMLKERDRKILDSEILSIRGLEHGKFLNSLA